MLDGRALGASQVEYKPFGKRPLKREGASQDLLPMYFSCMPPLDLFQSHCPASQRRIWK